MIFQDFKIENGEYVLNLPSFPLRNPGMLYINLFAVFAVF